MRVIFSVYNEDREADKTEFLFTKTIDTNLTIQEIDNRLQLYEGFRSVLMAGQHLVFWDIFCYFDFSNEIINKIDKIPSDKRNIIEYKDISTLVIKQYDPGNTDSPFYPDLNRCHFYYISRFECGASGFNEIIALLMKNPVLASLIACAIWEIIKKICVALWRLITKGRIFGVSKVEKTVYFSCKKFYSSFSKLHNIDKCDIQIINLKTTKKRLYKVYVRTINNQMFETLSKANGQILSSKPVDINSGIWR